MLLTRHIAVVVAGLQTAHAASPVARMLDGMLAATFPFVVSEALLAEVHAVLVRPALLKLHGLSVTDVETLLTDIAQHAIVLVLVLVLVPVAVAVAVPPAPDPGDPLLCGLLAARDDLRLVTGDKALLRDAGMHPRVVTPQSFLQGL